MASLKQNPHLIALWSVCQLFKLPPSDRRIQDLSLPQVLWLNEMWNETRERDGQDQSAIAQSAASQAVSTLMSGLRR